MEFDDRKSTKVPSRSRPQPSDSRGLSTVGLKPIAGLVVHLPNRREIRVAASEQRGGAGAGVIPASAPPRYSGVRKDGVSLINNSGISTGHRGNTSIPRHELGKSETRAQQNNGPSSRNERKDKLTALESDPRGEPQGLDNPMIKTHSQSDPLARTAPVETDQQGFSRMEGRQQGLLAPQKGLDRTRGPPERNNLENNKSTTNENERESRERRTKNMRIRRRKIQNEQTSSRKTKSNKVF